MSKVRSTAEGYEVSLSCRCGAPLSVSFDDGGSFLRLQQSCMCVQSPLSTLYDAEDKMRNAGLEVADE